MARRLFLYCLLFVSALVFGGCQTAQPVATASDRGFHALSYQHIVDTLCSTEMEGRDAGTKGIELARDYLVWRFKLAGLEPAFVVNGKPSYLQPLTLKIGKDKDDNPIEAGIHNVGGLLPGVGNLADEVVIIGAHYDHIGYGHYGSRDPHGKGHIHPGADDNASGTAGVILLADRLSKQAKANADDATPRRTILFTGFAGEERGLHGSRYMTEHPDQWVFDGEKVSGMINMDMIGRLRNDELYAFSHTTGKQWRGWIESANQSVGLALNLDTRAPGGSDHIPFIKAGIPAVFFNTWLHEDVHKPSDTPAKINAHGSVRVLSLVSGLLEQATTATSRISFVEPPPRPFLGANLGDHEKGVLIRRLTNKGPLAKAGFKNGDIIVSFDGKPTKVRRDLLELLNKTKPGDEVQVGSLRDGKSMPVLTVTIGKR